MEAQDAADTGADPTALVNPQLVRRLGRRAGHHAQFHQHVFHAAHAHIQNRRLDFQRLTRFEDDHVAAGFHRLAAERPVGALAMDHQFAAERLGESPDAGLVQVAADVGEVGSPRRGGVQIDPELASLHDFLKHDAGDAGGEAAVGIAREAAVEVASVGHVARLILEAEDVDNRHEHQRAGGELDRPPGTNPAMSSWYISSWMTPTPLSSSPWIAAVTNIVGPGFLARMTRIGRWIGSPV